MPSANVVANTVRSPPDISVVVSIVFAPAPFATSATRSLIVVDPRYVSAYSAQRPSGTTSRSIPAGIRGGHTANGSSACLGGGASFTGAAHAAAANTATKAQAEARTIEQILSPRPVRANPRQHLPRLDPTRQQLVDRQPAPCEQPCHHQLVAPVQPRPPRVHLAL